MSSRFIPMGRDAIIINTRARSISPFSKLRSNYCKRGVHRECMNGIGGMNGIAGIGGMSGM